MIIESPFIEPEKFVSKLSEKNFLKVLDVAEDIYDAVQVTEAIDNIIPSEFGPKIEIPSAPIKNNHPVLRPEDSNPSQEQYRGFREEALTLLMGEGYIYGYEPVNRSFGKEQLLHIKLTGDGFVRFNKLFDLLLERQRSDKEKQLDIEGNQHPGHKPDVELSINGLQALHDGTVRYKGATLKMRKQIRDLCILFMRNHDRVIGWDTIREWIIRADKRDQIQPFTIAKYVSELHGILQLHLKKEVLFNQAGDGWSLKIEK